MGHTWWGWVLSSEVLVELAAPEEGQARRLSSHEEVRGAAGPQTCHVSWAVLNGHCCQKCPQPHPAVLRKEGGSLQSSVCTQHNRPRRTPPPHPRTQSWWL